MTPDDLGSPPLSAVLRTLDATTAGLDGAEVERRRRRYGPNRPLAHGRRPPWVQFLSRFLNPLVLILLFASGLSAATGNVASFVIVLAMVLLSVTLDFVQEMRAETAVDALRRSVALRVRVRRDGIERSEPAEQLVPGDVVRLAAGDLVPADCRLIEARDLFVNQAMLTGEPYPVEKHADAPDALSAPHPDPAEALDTVFMGTSVISGSGLALVCRTGDATAFGQLSGTLQAPPPPTAFELGIRRFGFLILRLTVVLVLFVLAVNTLFHRPWLESLMFALALAVGLTPELLPMIVTVTLARGAMRLAKRRVIVKRLAAMHNIGAMDLLCTDKTGTLTEATIRMVRHLDGRGAESERVFRLAYLNSRFESGIRSPLDEAILAFRAVDLTGWEKIDEVPFDFERRRVSVLVANGAERLLVVKGAPEDVLRQSTHYETGDGAVAPLDPAARAGLDRLFQTLGEDGFRVLAIASKTVGADHVSAALADESDLAFAGYAVFLDPPKPSAMAAIHALTKAGVNIRILTGDNERVTRHVCAELGLTVTGLLTGDDLRGMSEEALRARLAKVNVFCRVTPAQKERVLLAHKRAGRVVGFLGDGINDASAIHAADIGISVDSAADVAKEAAGVILLDQDLSVVQEAVMEGRRTVQNVTKYILMGSSSNFGNMFSMAGASLFLPFLPMLPIQVLLNNLLYDASEASIPFDTVEAEALARPAQWDLRLIQRFMLVLGPVSSLFDFLTFYVLIHVFGAGEALFQTGWFVESLATQVLVIFVIRTRRSSLRDRPPPVLIGLTLGAATVGALLPLTPLGAFFGFVVPPVSFYLFLAAAVATYLLLVETVKRLFFRCIAPRPGPGRRNAPAGTGFHAG
ncbi:magnesium-translocating P-type ATPase [Azospirillum doebereinerae]|uniref:Magnesium-transporting ATPase, P-type 1 n=1 Tax=Azospirillum doebereinerae TaxID=92933 RepID=A0A3S0XNI9_9PROT|nr:magnesium-translocating P-type ATPase [Azospirillum doebereinerae]RUQ72800.1 magnesium-translocating P-type ATPase [Azospirillum doebereinerae]